MIDAVGRRRVRQTLAALLWSLGLASGSAAQTPVEPQDAPLRYRVVIDAPRSLAELLRNVLDIVRWQEYDDMTAIVLERLIREAKDQATAAVATEGYFSPIVDIALEPPESATDRRIVRVALQPGDAVIVTGVRLEVTGPATTDLALGSAAVAAIRRDWSLRMGERFRQVEWDSAKTRSVGTLASSPYAAARIMQSEARIDPVERSATLDVELESGPLFRFGPLQIEGLEAYDPAMVRRFSTLAPGEPYTSERLDQYVRRLQASGYFASVQARIEPDPAQADAAPIRMSIIEAPRRRIEGGVAYSTDNQVRGDFRYTDVNINRHATQLEVTGRVDQKIQNLGFRLTRPPGDNGYLDSFRAQAERTDIANLQTHAALVGIHRQTVEESNRMGYTLTYYEDDQRPQGLPAERSRALYAAFERTWRNVDALVAPTRGTVFDAEVGGSPLATRLFGRVIGKFAWWVPVGRDNNLFFRMQAGAVLAGSRSGIPSALLFRTGGDTTVRGYAFESLGVKRGDATVGGRYYAIASAEATHYFTERFGAAVFLDAGNAGDNLSSLRPVFGYGIGARIKSPIGPFRVDVAYGQESRQVRLHLSVGIAF